VTLLLHLVEKVPFLSEVEHLADVDLVRQIEKELGLSGIVPPAAIDANQMPVPPAVDPGPLAEPVPAEAQVPPPTFAASNAFGE
jgi:hypothetical protein